MLSQEQSQANDWVSLEIWLDKTSNIPYVLLLLKNRSNTYFICDPAEEYKIIEEFSSFEQAKNWLLEDEYESFGREDLTANVLSNG